MAARLSGRQPTFHSYCANACRSAAADTFTPRSPGMGNTASETLSDAMAGSHCSTSSCTSIAAGALPAHAWSV